MRIGQRDAYRSLVREIARDDTVKAEAATLSIGVFYMHVSQYCNLNCRHCGADAVLLTPKEPLDPSFILSWERVESVIALLNSGYSGEITVAGGGEPTLELPKILEVARRSHCASIVVVTNGAFGISRAGARQCLNSFSGVSAGRAPAFPLTVKLCISVDSFHQEKLPLRAIRNIIAARMELDAQKPALLPPEIIFKTLYGFDAPLQQLAQSCGACFEPPTREEEEGRFSVGSALVIPVQYARFMTKSARSKSVTLEVPLAITEDDVFPKEGTTPYRIGGRPGLLDLRVFEDGEIVTGREGHHNLVLGHLDESELTIEGLKQIAVADPIVKTLRENGLERVLAKATAIIPEIAEEVEKINVHNASFLVERILHTILKDETRRSRIAYELAVDERSPHSSAFAELAEMCS